jgi:hypothetical protein
MSALVAGIHALLAGSAQKKDVDGRVKPGHYRVIALLMLNRRRFIIVTAASALALPALAAPPGSPEAPIVAIYARAAAGNGENGGNFVYQEKKDRARWLSKSFAKAWNDADAATPKGDETPPGFDPVSNSQNPKVLNVKVEVEKNNGKRATVAASFDSWPPGNTVGEQRANPPKRLTVRYDMVFERGRWRIDDIRGDIDGKSWSIRAILKSWNR